MTPRTIVRNLMTKEQRRYNLSPEEAVVVAYERAGGNQCPYPPFEVHPEAFEGGNSVACGDFAALKEPDVYELMDRYPRIVAHLICESLGYATPERAVWILIDAVEGRENHCEWVSACFGCDPRVPVSQAIARRHNHKGYMAEYRDARAIVTATIENRRGPELASWF